MGIPSIDTYLKKEIESLVKGILQDKYLTEYILADFDEEERNKFIQYYVEEGAGEDIPFTYTLPNQSIKGFTGSIWISLKQGAENDEESAIGSNMGNYEKPLGNHQVEQCIITEVELDGDLYSMIQTSLPLAYKPTILEISDLSQWEIDEDDKRNFYFPYDEEWMGREVTVHYIDHRKSKDGTYKEDGGMNVGFRSTEAYSVIPISTNMLVVRCLDALVKASLIFMRTKAKELSDYQLQRLQFAELTERFESEGDNTEILYGRETMVFYQTDYTLELPMIEKIEQVKLTQKVRRSNGRLSNQ